MHSRRFRRPARPANNAVDEQRGVGELPEDLMSDRAIRHPILSPRIKDFAPGTSPLTIGPKPSNMPGTSEYVNNYKYSPYPFLAQLVATKIITANQRRVYLLIQNKSASSIFVNYGTVPTAFNAFEIVAGGSQEFIGGQHGPFCPADDVYVLGGGADLECMASEGSYIP